MISKYLVKNNFIVHSATNVKDAFSVLKKEFIDLIVLDLNLGDADGTEIILSLRRQNIDTPVIVISTIENIDCKVKTFEAGCDDYLTKPFYNEELLIRIKKLISQNNSLYKQAKLVQQEIISGPFRIDLQSYMVYKNKIQIQMKKKLFSLFLYFIQNENIVLSKEQIYNRVWGNEELYNDNTITVHLHLLRTLVEADCKSPLFIKTIKGVGFIYSSTGASQE